MTLNRTAYRVFIIILTVGIACAAYTLVLARLLEAPIKEVVKRKGTEKTPVRVESPFAPYFQEGAWECTPNVAHLVNSKNIVMFFRNIAVEGNKGKSDACTILIAPGEKTFPMTKNPGKTFYPVKVNIGEGAEILFDSNILQFSAPPTPQKGELHGPVQISYKVRINGFLTDCLVRTKDLFCDMKSLQTSDSVEFFMGTFSAKGSELKILFQESANQGEFFSGITSVELGKLEHITFRLNPMLLQQMKFKMNPEMEQRIRKMFGQKSEIPITLTCKGPMYYNVKDGVIKFSQEVKLSCNYPNAPPDMLKCEELELHLASDLEKRFLNTSQSPDESAIFFKHHQTFANSEELKTASENLNPESLTFESLNFENQPDSSAPKAQNSQTDKESEVAAASQMFPENDSSMGNFPIKSIQAKQKVQVEIPTFNAKASAENLTFHIENQTLQLSGSQQAALYFNQHEFHAFNLSYTLPARNTQGLGEIRCEQRGGWLKTRFSPQSTPGLGTAQSQTPQENSKSVTVEWNEGLRGIPRETGRYELYVTGSVLISSPEFGSLKADSISARLRNRTQEDDKNDANLALELGILPPQTNGAGNRSLNSVPETEKKPNFIPEYVVASGNVHLKVNQPKASLNAQLTKIQFMFQKPIHVPDALLQAQKARSKENAGNNQNDSRLIPQPPQDSASSRDSTKRDFILTAGELQGVVQLLPGEEGFFIPQLSLSAPAGQELVLREEAPLLTSEQLISLRAQKIMLHDLLPETLQGEIIGSDAVLSGLGCSFESAKMAINCASNRIDVNCPGKMRVFTRQKAGTNLNYSTLMETVISWQKSLTFNGLEVTALENVTVKAPMTTLRMDCAQVLLTEKIQLNKPPQISKNKEDPLESFQSIAAKHNVKLVHLNFDQNSDLTNVCTLETNFLNYFPGNKKVSMNGEGILCVSYLGNTKSSFTSLQEEKNSPAPAPAAEKKWHQIRMDYNGGISGTLQDGEFVIKDKISALVQPVNRPDFVIPQTHIDPRLLPDGGFQFTCDQVTIDKIPTYDEISTLHQMPNLKDLKLEVKAEGNVKFETSSISADGVTLKYSQEKNMCQILGDERTQVYIIQQEFVGGKRNEMTTDAVEVNLNNLRLNLSGVTIQGSY